MSPKRRIYLFSVLTSLTLVGLMMLAAVPPLGLVILGLVGRMLYTLRQKTKMTPERKAALAHAAFVDQLHRDARGGM